METGRKGKGEGKFQDGAFSRQNSWLDARTISRRKRAFILQTYSVAICVLPCAFAVAMPIAANHATST